MHLDEQHPGRSSAQIVIKTHSIDTGNADRDRHLRGNDFLAMDEFPEITFTSTAAGKADEQADGEDWSATRSRSSSTYH